MDPVTLTTFILVVAAIAWNYAQLRNLERRISSLEKQHLALIAELEEQQFDMKIVQRNELDATGIKPSDRLSSHKG